MPVAPAREVAHDARRELGIGEPRRPDRHSGGAREDELEEILRRLRGAGVRTSAAVQRQAAEDTEGDIVDALVLATDPCACAVPREAIVEGWVW